MRWWTLVWARILTGCGGEPEAPVPPPALTSEPGVRAEEHANPVDPQLGPEDLADGRLEGTRDIDGVQRLVAEVRGVPGTTVEGVFRFDRVSGGVRMVGSLRGLPAGTARAAVHAGTDCSSVDAIGPELDLRGEPEPRDPSMARHMRGPRDATGRPPPGGPEAVQAAEALSGGQVSGDLVERVQVGAGETATVRGMLEDVDLSQLVGRTVVVEVQGTPGATVPGNLAGCGVLQVADLPG